MDPSSLKELIPDFIERGAPLEGEVKKDEIERGRKERHPNEQWTVGDSGKRGKGIGQDEEHHHPIDEREGGLETAELLGAGTSPRRWLVFEP